jgi:SAM-dependent methyltransferase
LNERAIGQYAKHLLFHEPLAVALVNAVVSEGDAVLDVACGAGIATRPAAQVAGASGRVVGTDLNPAMVAVAASIPNEPGCEITWQEASALELPFADGEFDAVVCSQGVQFFPDKAAGLAEMARVAVSGGRLGVAVWTQMADSPFFDAQFDMLVDHCGVDPALPNGAFTTGEDQVRGWFTSAGLDSVEVVTVSTTASLPPVREFSPVHLSAVPWSEGFFELDDQARYDAVTDVEDRLGDYRTDEGIDVPFVTFIAITTT